MTIIHQDVQISLTGNGYGIVSQYLTAEELSCLQWECNLLARALRENPLDAINELCNNGCVVDVMTNCPMPMNSSARTSRDVYIENRMKEVSAILERSYLLSFGINWDFDLHKSTLENLLFQRLPIIARKLFHMFRQNAASTGIPVYLFNEHYVVKPPKTDISFRWHRDDQEQLAMTMHNLPSDDEKFFNGNHVYLSLWCALDDVSISNGTIEFSNADSQGDDRSGIPITAKAGDIVGFFSNIWHCSKSNASQSYRRVYYAQYSMHVITASALDNRPLSFAIPCLSGINMIRRKGDCKLEARLELMVALFASCLN